MRALLFLIFFAFGSALCAGGRDTTIYRRTYYLGIASAFSSFQKEYRSPSDLLTASVDYRYSTIVLRGGGLGLVYDFPFASRYSCEINAQYFRYVGYRFMPTGYAPDTDGIGFHYTGWQSTWFSSNELNCRLVFAAELFRTAGFSIHAGLGGWALAAGNRENGNVGVEVILKSWIPVSRGGAVQAGVAYGYTESGSYIQLRAGFALRGTRIYKHRPSKYYVRTYEVGE